MTRETGPWGAAHRLGPAAPTPSWPSGRRPPAGRRRPSGATAASATCLRCLRGGVTGPGCLPALAGAGAAPRAARGPLFRSQAGDAPGRAGRGAGRRGEVAGGTPPGAPRARRCWCQCLASACCAPGRVQAGTVQPWQEAPSSHRRASGPGRGPRDRVPSQGGVLTRRVPH